MNRVFGTVVGLGLSWLVWTAGVRADDPPPAVADVTVVKAEAGFAMARAGVEPADVLLRWRRLAGAAERGETLASYFHLKEVEILHAPRGGVDILVRRGETERWVAIPAYEWRLSVRPALSGEAGVAQADGERLLGARDVDGAVARWSTGAAEAATRGDHLTAAWLHLRSGQALAEAKRWAAAVDALGHCADTLAAVEAGRFQPIVWDMQGELLRQDKRPELSVEMHRKALAAWAHDGGELGRANSMASLGHCAWQLVRWPEAVQCYENALAIRREVAPDSMLVSGSLMMLATAYSNTGDLAAADRCLLEALAIHRRHLPGHAAEANILNTLGVNASKAGHQGKAHQYFEESLRLKQAQSPDSMAVAYTLNNLAAVARLQGDLALAEDYHRQALKIKLALEPDSASLARSYHNIGQIYMARRDFPAAADYLNQALQILERKAPRSRECADCLEQLGNLARLENKFDLAEKRHQEATAIRMQVSNDPLDQIRTLITLGAIRLESGDPVQAETHYQAALSMARQSAPASFYEARSLRGLGDACLRRGDLVAAAPALEGALKIFAATAPLTIDEATTQHLLGDLHRRQDRLQDALACYERAVAALEGQLEKLGGSREVAESFAAEYAGFYKDVLELKLLLNDPRGAFNVLERFRARSLLAMLVERDLDFSRDVPAGLLERLETARTRSREAQDELMQLSPDKEPERVTECQRLLSERRREQALVWEEIRRESPRLAALRAPETLTADQVAEVMGRDTLFLSYAVSERATHLFALLNGQLRVESVPLGRQQVQEAVEYYLAMLSNPASRKVRLMGRAHALYRQLVAPVDDLVRRSQRIVVCPDGPLHMMPFAALGPATNRYLIEEKPVSYVISATVYADGLRHEPQRASRPVVLFGDPDYPGQAAGGSAARLLRWVLRDDPVPPLPASRDEVQGIAALYPGAHVAYLGAEAREERVKSLDRQPGYLHFACHGFYNPVNPMDSGLLLTIPGEGGDNRDNGFLQVWEVFENVRIDAEQVSLSACETARGRELGGEGLVGLNRSFLYAGARTVMSTLWSVADASTAEFQKLYYRHLRSDRAKTEAARLAQREFINGKVHIVPTEPAGEPPDLSHPYFWAGFVLNGQWR